MAVPQYPTDKGGSVSAIQAAAIMYGTGSKQHLAAIKKFSGGTKKKTTSKGGSRTQPRDNKGRWD